MLFMLAIHACNTSREVHPRLITPSQYKKKEQTPRSSNKIKYIANVCGSLMTPIESIKLGGEKNGNEFNVVIGDLIINIDGLWLRVN
jgi:hypothetical protein